MNNYFISLILTIIIFEKYCDCKISILPKNNVLQGERVNISCYWLQRPSLLFWKHNGIEVGEFEKSYNLKSFEITKTDSRLDLIIRSATLSDRGSWNCRMDSEDNIVVLNVTVPWSFKSVRVTKLPKKTPSSSSTGNPTLETGEKKWPYNLLNNRSINVICETECGLPAPKSIIIKHSNSTNNGELSGGTQVFGTCENKELQKLTHTITINCEKQNLRGLNEILCQSHDINGNSISNKPFYILCPAFPRPEILTNGEKIAITISVILALVDIIIIALLLRNNCRNLSHDRNPHHKFDKSNCPEVML